MADVAKAGGRRSPTLLARSDELHRSLVDLVLRGGGLDELCSRLGELWQGAIFVTTSDGRVLATAGDPEKVAASLRLDCFDRTGRFVVEREPVGLREDPSDRGADRESRDGRSPDWRRRAVVPIGVGPIDHGRLVAVCPARDLGADDIGLLERAAAIAALTVAKAEAVATVESRYRAEFVRDALAGRAGDDDQALAHAESLGLDLSGDRVVVVAEIDTDDEAAGLELGQVRAVQERFARAWSRAVATRDRRSPCIGFSREVVAILRTEPATSRETTTEATMRAVRDLARTVRGDGGGGRRSFSTGVSRILTSPAELPAAYADALRAVTVGRQMHGEGALVHFDGLGIFRLLSLVPDGADLRRFVLESLGELATDAGRESADLRRTLSVLLDTNLNVAETARILHYHYNTLRYRIAKLERMLGPFTTDPELRLTLALALKVVEMRGV